MDNVTKAKINLFAVLRNLEDLCAMDEVSAEIIKDVKLTVSFSIPDVGAATLKFADGKCTFIRDRKNAALRLWFTSAEHFNKLIDGEKTIPVFINVFKAGFLLGAFTKLADRLGYFLKPSSPDLLKDPKFFEINTTLTIYTALYGMCEIANSDAVGKVIAGRIEDGVINCGVIDGPSVGITAAKHHLSCSKGAPSEWKASMSFADMDFAHNLLNGLDSSFGGMGSGKFQVKGAVDMLEQMAKLLSLVGFYLA